MGEDFRRRIGGTWMGKGTELGNVCFFTENNDYFYRYMWTTIKWLWIDLDEPSSFLDHVCLGCTQRECRPDGIERYKEMFESRISAGQLKVTSMGKTSRKNCNVVLRHGRICSNMRGKVSRIGDKKDRATVQSSKPLFGR